LPWLAEDFLRARFLRAFLAMFLLHFVSGVTPESVMRYRYRRRAPSARGYVSRVSLAPPIRTEQ
jgi:hypothetical protein